MNRKELVLDVAKNPLIRELLDKTCLSKQQLVKFVLLEAPVPSATDDQKERMTQIFEAMALAIPHMQKLKQAIEKMIPVMNAPTTAPAKAVEKYAESMINEETKEITNRKEIVQRLEKSKDFFEQSIEYITNVIKNREKFIGDDTERIGAFVGAIPTMINTFDLETNKKREDFLTAAGTYTNMGITAYMITQIKPQYQMIKNLIAKVGGGRVTYDTGKIDTQMEKIVIDEIGPTTIINTEAGEKEVRELSTSEYFEALKHNLRNGIPLRGYLKPAGSPDPDEPEQIDEVVNPDKFLDSDTAEVFGNSLQDVLGAYQTSSNRLIKRIDNMMAIYGTEGQITSKNFFGFFENLKTLAKESEKNEDEADKLMTTLNMMDTDELTVVSVDGKRYLLNKIAVRLPSKSFPQGKTVVTFSAEEASPPKIEKWPELFKLLPSFIKSFKDQGREQIQYQKTGDMSKAQRWLDTVKRLIRKQFKESETVEIGSATFATKEVFPGGEVDTHTIIPELEKHNRFLNQNYKPSLYQEFEQLLRDVHERLKDVVKDRPEPTPPTPAEPSLEESLENKLKTIIEQTLQGKYG